jgi:hypothetical protein
MTASKARVQSNREKVPTAKPHANAITPERNPPQRPLDEARQQPGPIEIGHHPNFSKSPGSREGK